jgi:peptidoglycan/LPS O-acetylase OafA/YrhL
MTSTQPAATPTPDPVGAVAAPAADPAVLAPRFAVLDTLRAVGALAVLTTHVAFYSGDYTRHGTLGSVLARLDVGVAIFFVLSGFLLARPHLARAALGLDRPPVGSYYLKRVLRIYPVYAVAVVLALVLLDDNRGLGARDWLVTLGLANTFVDPLPPEGLTQMWSLGVEATFYLVLPLLMLAATDGRVLRVRRVVAVLLAMSALSVWWHLDGAGRAGRLTDAPPLQWLPAYLVWFAVGIGLALVHVLDATGRRWRVVTSVLAAGRQPGACWTVAVALLLIAATPLAGPTALVATTPGQSLTKNLLYAGVAGLIVLTGVVAAPGGHFADVLGRRLARRLGLISYSLFCLHLLILDLVAPALGFGLFQGHGLVLWVVTVVLSLVAAELAYRFVELPGIGLKRRLGPSGARPAETTTATSGTSDR